MRSPFRSILLSPLFLVLAAASLTAQNPQATSEPTTRTIKFESTARCDVDVRITQDGRAVVSRVVLEQLGHKTLQVEVSDNSPLIMHVKGRQCNIGYSIDVPLFQGNTLTFEVADTPQMVVVRR